MTDVVVFTDIQARNRAERERLERIKGRLEQEKVGKTGAALQELKGQIAEIDRQLASVADPMVERVRNQYQQLTRQSVLLHDDGMFESQRNKQDLDDAERALAAIYGMLKTDHTEAANLADVASALAEYRSNEDLYQEALGRLIEEGRSGQESHVRADEWITIARHLRDKGISARDDRMPRMVRGAAVLELITANGHDPSGIKIDLPNLDTRVNRDIARDNILAMQAIYFAAILDLGNVFSVIDTLVDPLNQSLKGITRGRVSDRMSRYWMKRNEWLSAADRANLFMLTLGLPDLPNVTAVQGANTDFPKLMRAFVNAVATHIQNLTSAYQPALVLPEVVVQAATELAMNLSQQGGGARYAVATELQTQIREILDLLSDDEVLDQFGAADTWGVVSAVSPAAPLDTYSCRTLAMSGAIIIRWLANKSHVLTSQSGDILDARELIETNSYSSAHDALDAPTDRDLVRACYQWQAASGALIPLGAQGTGASQASGNGNTPGSGGTPATGSTQGSDSTHTVGSTGS